MENAKSFSDVSLDQFVQDFSQGALLEWSGDTNLLSIAKKQFRLLNQFKTQRKRVVHIQRHISLVHQHQSVTSLHMVCIDKPFITNSVFNAIRRLGLEVEITQTNVIAHSEGDCVYSLWVEFNKQLDSDEVHSLKSMVTGVCKDINQAVRDWRPMQKRLATVTDSWCHHSIDYEHTEAMSEIAQFIEWLQDYFTFLGVRSYRYADGCAQFIEGSGLGLLRHQPKHAIKSWLNEVPAHFEHDSPTDALFLFSKTNTMSTVHRATYTDILVMRRFDASGCIIGEDRFIGLLTSDAYDSDPTRIPFIRRKVQAILDHMALESRNANKTVLHLLKHLPRLELFQAGFDSLVAVVKGVLLVQHLKKIKLFIRRDTFKRFFSCIVYCPRDVFNTELKHRMCQFLTDSLGGAEYNAEPFFSEFQFAQLHVIIKVDPDQVIEPDVLKLEHALTEMAKTWAERFYEALNRIVSLQDAQHLVNRYDVFTAQYRNHYSPELASDDVLMIESLTSDQPLKVSLYQNELGGWNLKFFELGRNQIELSSLVPILDHIGIKALSEHSFKFQHPDGDKLYLSDVQISLQESLDELEFKARRGQLIELLQSVIVDNGFNDPFNRLVLTSGLTLRQVQLLRAMAAYFQQLGVAIQQGIMAQVLSRYPLITKYLMQFFAARFEPSQKHNRSHVRSIEASLTEAIAAVDDFYDDQVLTLYFQMMSSLVRTNYFCDVETLAFKVDTSMLDDAPKPVPAFDVFVFGRYVEGVYLRTSKVARGGIRWSSRHIDYRTEVLGLMNAQQTKNAIIVPSGAKGGFVCRKELDDCYDFEEGKRCYRAYIEALLSITDNRVRGMVKHPKRVKCYDGKDDYLVVAPDKGTATFSDLANEIAKDQSFWLADAFASGGSEGYDHKLLAITAKSAWVSALWHMKQLHLSEYGLSVVGIGDMSGDVFGNGLLLMKCQLKAAFNHQHIFLDPTPDVLASYDERCRLFALPRSTWADYDESVISSGGGVFERHAKFIPLSAEVQHMLGIKRKRMAPDQLIQCILGMSVDLIWNGGIGTYIKADLETQAMIGDRQNDGCRINASDVKARMVAEGGNLGLTQLARIQYNAQGGAVNTDYIDNSGGVDCSDHEVNIKIVLEYLLSEGRIDLKQKYEMLRTCQKEVVDLVLGNTLKQNIAISMAEVLSSKHGLYYKKLIQKEVSLKRLKRKLACLPHDDELDARAQKGKLLYRPELAFLMGHMKNTYQSILLAEGSIFGDESLSYLEMMLPSKLIKKMDAESVKHPLHQPLVATAVSNELINQLGMTFVDQMQDEFDVGVSDVVKVFMFVRRLFSIDAWTAKVEEKFDVMSSQQILDVAFEIRHFVCRACHWVLRHKSFMARFKGEVFSLKDLVSGIDDFIDRSSLKRMHKKTKGLLAVGFEYDDALVLTRMGRLYVYLNAMTICDSPLVHVERSIMLYNMLSKALGVFTLRSLVVSLDAKHRWDVLQKSAMEAQLDECLVLSMQSLLRFQEKHKSMGGAEVLRAWLKDRGSLKQQWDVVVSDMRKAIHLDRTMLSVSIMQLYQLVKHCV